MNVFFEFHKIVQHLQTEEIEYALIGGVAMAFHAEPRFTKDVDILIRGSDLTQVNELLQHEGYQPSASPWKFANGNASLHRFIKIESGDEMIVDIIVAGDDRYEKVITNALEAVSEGTGKIRVAGKNDLIWLKKIRNSKQDQADIARLSGE